MLRADIINKVRVKLDEITTSDQDVIVAFEEHVKPIDKLIDELLDIALTDVMMECPLSLVPMATTIGTLVRNPDLDEGIFQVPPDFLRLVDFKLTSWKYPIYDFLPTTDPSFLLQNNDFTRGGVSKPKAFWIYDSVVRVIPVLALDEVDTWEYVARLSSVEDASEKLVEALTWYVAAQVYQIMGLTDSMTLAKQGLIDYYNRHTYVRTGFA